MPSSEHHTSGLPYRLPARHGGAGRQDPAASPRAMPMVWSWLAKGRVRSSEPFWSTVEALITMMGCLLVEPDS